MARFKQSLYYKKDKKAQIYKKVSGGRDDRGFPIGDNYYPIAASQIWCYTSQLSQQEVFSAATYGDNETRIFVFNYYNGIEIYDMINYKNTWYSITRIDTADDYNGETFIYVKSIKEKPKDDAIKPYTPGIWE